MVRPTMNILTLTILAENNLGFSFYHEEYYMDKNPKFNFYRLNEDYMSPLQKSDNQVQRSTEDKSTRPYIGIVLNVENRLYFAPLSSAKRLPDDLDPEERKREIKRQKNIEKNRMSIKLLADNNNHLCNVIIGKMIPVPESQIKEVLINDYLGSSNKVEHDYGMLLKKEFLAINKLQTDIEKTAQSFYKQSINNTLGKEKQPYCVNLKQAIKYHDHWIERENIYKKDNTQDNKKDKSKDFSR